MEATNSKVFGYCVMALLVNTLFTLTSVSMAGPYIISELGGSLDTVTYMISLYGIANAATLPLGRWLGGRLGRQEFTLICVKLYIVFTFCLMIAPNFPVFMILRVLQGSVAGPLLFLLSSLTGNLATEDQRLGFIKNFAVIYLVTTLTASCVGGVIAYLYDWRWIFFLEGSAATINLLVFQHHLRAQTYELNKKTFDLWGFIGFFLSIWSFSIFVIFGHVLDWLTSYTLRAMVVIFCIAFPFFIAQIIRHRNPIFNFSIFKYGRLTMGIIQLGTLFMVYYGMTFLLNLWLHLDANFTPLWISAVLCVVVLSVVIILYVVSKLKFTFTSHACIAGLLLLVIAFVLAMNFNPKINLLRIATARIIAGMGFALALPPLMHIMLMPCAEEEGLEGLMLFQLVRMPCCCMGISVFSTMWYRREIFYHSRLGSYLTPFSEKVGNFFVETKEFFFTPAMSKGGLDIALQQQSTSLGLSDCFYVMAIIAVLMIVSIVGYNIYENWKNRTNASITSI